MTSSLQLGIDAAKSGQMEKALTHLKDAIVEEPENANVWVWLAAIIEDEEKQTVFLKKALEIDPANRPAQRGLAFIDRKKYIPPKPGEKLSDYTKPIGIFKSAPTESEVPQSEPGVADVAIQEAANPVSASTPQAILEEPKKRKFQLKNKQWLDIVLYGLTLMVFIVIGILIGTTLLNVNLPFLSKPTPVLSVLPPSNGVFLQNGDEYATMEIHLNAPVNDEGIPVTKQLSPAIVVNELMIDMDRIQVQNQDGTSIPFQRVPAENSISIITPQGELTTGRYCLVYELNVEKNESLYWCLKVEP